MADQVGNIIIRDYRKGNWTLGETMVLIEAKKMDDERRMKRNSDNNNNNQEGGSLGRSSSKPAELRWKWVEDYCFRKGCLRSQNQCNDKWDNLMRDYKKVRDYERRLSLLASNNNNNEGNLLSYWKLEKNERKDKNLPSNMLFQVYEALVEVVEKKGGQRMVNSNSNLSYGVERLPICSSVHVPPQPLIVPPLLQHQVSVSIPLSPPPPPPPSLPPPQHQPQPVPHLQCTHQPLPGAVDGDETSEYSDTPAKRRRRRRDGGGDERSSGSGGASGSGTMEMGNAISRSAAVIAEAIQACEERKERRHRDLLKLQQRRLQIEEANNETNKKSINGLVDAINNLANSILALASHKKS
ncbi:hydroxyproline-rich glycoprotein family protein [Euphorbia peplus]|nr:hydroxyproline-rich glycoprotein family protein [Euphorbia peplus]